MAEYYGTKTEKNDRDSWQTPTFVYRWLDELIRGFDVDLACTTLNCRAKRGIYFDQGLDALTEDWTNYGKTGFCNPPYSSIDPFIEKAIAEQVKGFITVMLIPSLNGEMRDHIIVNNATLYFIAGRLSFINPKTLQPVSGNNRGSMIAIFNGMQGIKCVKRDDIKRLYS